jgi:hypothetical protein
MSQVVRIINPLYYVPDAKWFRLSLFKDYHLFLFFNFSKNKNILKFSIILNTLIFYSIKTKSLKGNCIFINRTHFSLLRKRKHMRSKLLFCILLWVLWLSLFLYHKRGYWLSHNFRLHKNRIPWQIL